MSRFAFIFLCWLCNYQSISGTLERSGTCTCSNATSTAQTVQRPQQYASCREALESNNKTGGVFKIFIPKSGLSPFFVYCLKDSKSNEAWMVIQRRINGNVYFIKKWYDYKIGFGDINGEYWLGLERLHILTNLKPHKLWIKLDDFGYVSHSVYYDMFVIGNENSQYTLSILGNYSGAIPDSFRIHVGQKFSTSDRDNDVSSKYNCAKKYAGGWWFRSCFECHLNGRHLNKRYLSRIRGILWNGWHGYYQPMKYVHMAIKPIEP